MRKLTAIALLAGFLIGGCTMSEDAAREAEIQGLIDQMTLQEKIDMIHASSAFTSGGVERLGIPELVMSDGPHGVRHEHGRYYHKIEGVADSSTYLPVGTALAATFNRDLGYQFGTVLGRETAFRGKDVILGPGINIIRDPLNGRNFEYMTEDPYLNGEMVVGYVKGVQEQGVAVSVKHYIANNLEYDRRFVNVLMDERTLREIYLPGYKKAVQEGGALTVMASYNKFRGEWVAENDYLLNQVLKDEYGFEGLVMSDWDAVHQTLPAVLGGLDIEMGTDLTQEWDNPDYSAFHMGDTLLTLVGNGTVDESIIDEKVRRILRVMHKIHIFSGDRPEGAYNAPEHQRIARAIADEAITLLKNDEILPLDRSAVRTLAVIGANATWKHAGAGGSSQVKAFYEVTPLEGLQNLLGDQVEIIHAQGYRIERESAADPELIREAVAAAASADAVVYVGGLIHGYSDAWEDNVYDAEVIDKPDMMLPFGQDVLIGAILGANPNTVVTLISGGPVDMTTWVDDTPAIVQMWYAGMEGGNALADVLFGEVNPSGKLPMTFPKRLEDSPAHALASYPDERKIIDHTERVYVGYRYFDTYDVEPAFAFGHGLSYTSFAYSDLAVERAGDGARVTVTVTNTGERAGAEVVQVYVSDDEASVDRPAQELKGFEKISLEPGASQTLEFVLDRGAFAFYDEAGSTWTVEPGSFVVHVGASSRDLRASGTIQF